MKKIFIFLAAAFILMGILFAWLMQETSMPPSAATSAASDAAIGGGFTLTDQDGHTVSDNDFRGRVMLVFFGFTHCPDLCPVMISTLSKTMEKLGPDADKVAPLFISVDPKRDTPAVLKDFLKPFDHHLIGLTGTDEQIAAVAKEYKAYYAKQDNGEGVDHSGILYVMDKNGHFVEPLPYDASPQEIADAVRPLLL